jgi:hypothetical protein
MLLVSANKALRTEQPKENIYGEIKITKKSSPKKPLKQIIVNKNTNIEEDIKKEQAIRKQIQKISNSGMSENKRNTQIKNLEKQLPKKDNGLSKEY